jgi:hypothetical protein
MNTPYVKSLTIVASVCVLIGSGLIFSCSVNAQQNTAAPILQCFHEGVAVITAPRVDDFLMTQAGIFVEARWTNPLTKEQEILVTTLPCLFHTTAPPARSRVAN